MRFANRDLTRLVQFFAVCARPTSAWRQAKSGPKTRP